MIRPAAEAAGLTCVRGDEIYSQQAVVQDIWASIRKARLVIAELSGRNANVMHEAGLAHAIGKPIVLLTRDESDVPFDLKALRYIFYDTNNPDWGSDLRAELTRAVSRVIQNPNLAEYLQEVRVETTLPTIPQQAIVAIPARDLVLDISGVWHGLWASIRREREHRATLVVPADHGNAFTASMTID